MFETSVIGTLSITVPKQKAILDSSYSNYFNSEDEFYYYKVPIEMNEHTSYLMTQIKISKDIPAHCVKDAEFIVYAESYQAEGFSNYQEAWENYQLNLKRIKR